MATLRTFCWAFFEGEETCKEVLIPFDKILCIQDHDGGKGDTCLISVSGSSAIHADVTLDEMRKIMDDHCKHPDKNIDTHDFSIGKAKPKTGSETFRAHTNIQPQKNSISEQRQQPIKRKQKRQPNKRERMLSVQELKKLDGFSKWRQQLNMREQELNEREQMLNKLGLILEREQKVTECERKLDERELTVEREQKVTEREREIDERERILNEREWARSSGGFSADYEAWRDQ